MTIDRARAQRLRLVVLDVDGVLTDGGLYIGDVAGAPVELKRYDIQDGLGVRFLRAAGLRVVIITGRESESVRIRGEELEVDAVIQDRHARKLAVESHRRALHTVSTRSISLSSSSSGTMFGPSLGACDGFASLVSMSTAS